MPLTDVLLRGSWYPAKSIEREDVGNLGVGSDADVAILGLEKGRFGFVDAANNRIEGDSKFTAEVTIRNGKVVWDLNGLSAKAYKNK